MRKASFATLALALGLVFGSCKKEYTCECTTTDSDGNEVESETSTKEFSSEDDAKDWCEEETSSGGLTTKCELQ